MTTATLALFIGTLLLAQAGAALILGIYRRQAGPLAVGVGVGALGTGTPERRPVADGLRTAGLPRRTDAARAGAPDTGGSGYRDFVVRRRVVEDQAGAVCSFYLEPADGEPLPPYRPGQYLTLKLAHPDPAGGQPQTLVRCYSLSDRPRGDCYRITVKRVPAPPGRPDLPPGTASNLLHDRIREGDRVAVRAPAGGFVLNAEGELPIVLVAGGIGITPLLAMLNTLAHWSDPREVWLFYGVRDGAEHIMKAHLEALRLGHPGLRLHVCYAQPRAQDAPGRDYQHRGRLDIALLRQVLPFGRYEFYLCGPPAMMESLVPALEAQGVAAADIRYESFGPASLARHPAAAPGPATAPTANPKRREGTAAAPALAVRFSRSGKSALWDPSRGSLAELAQAQGIAVPSGCRAGACGCCETAIESGRVEYAQTPEANIADGHCLLCVARPASDLTLDL